MKLWILCFGLMAGQLAAQEYDTPADHQHIEQFLQADLSMCLQLGEGYERDLTCGSSLFNKCTGLSKHGETTAGFSICGGVVSNVLDREMNVVWAMIKRLSSKNQYSRILAEQRSWLKFRQIETQAAANRYSGGSMGSYSGWIKYDELSTIRVARLIEIATGLK